MAPSKEIIKAFWDSQAVLGEKAGTQDTILHQLEVEAIAKYIKDGDTVLDVGCGNGATIAELSQHFPQCTWRGVDYSEAMLEVARSRIQKHSSFFYGNVLILDQLLDITSVCGQFDIVFTKRCLINLASWEEQKRAIENIWSLLKPGGLYVMCEASQDGLDEINQLRACLSLPAITSPWHNCYFRDALMQEMCLELNQRGLACEGPDYFLSTYAYLSRVVNACLAADMGVEPDYNSPINRLALQLPTRLGKLGQYVLWIIRRLP